MIIPSPTSPKSPLVIKDQDDAEGSIAPPPSYGAAEESQPLLPDRRTSLPSDSESPTDPLLAAEAGEPQVSNSSPKKGPRRRTCVLLLVALAVILPAFIIITVLSRRSSSSNDRFPWVENGTYSLPEGVKLTACHDIVQSRSESSFPLNDLELNAQGSERQFGSDNSIQHIFRVPFTSRDSLFVLSAGVSQFGTAKISTSSVLDDAMQVKITYFQSSTQDPDLVRACTARRGRRDLGVVILTPKSLYSEQGIHVRTEIVLPQFTDTQIRGFEGVFQRNDIEVKDVAHLQFEDFSLITLGKVDVDSLHSHVGAIRTENGYIRGSFITSGNLDLRTSNEPIEAAVEVNPTEKLDPAIRLVTNNKPIKLDLSLRGSDSTTYGVDIRTTNARLDFHILTQPLGSKLLLMGETTNAPINAELDPGYSGDFRLNSFNAREPLPEVAVHDAPGESGHWDGHRRTVQVDYSRPSTMAGAIYWDSSRPTNKGQIFLRTTLRPIQLLA